MTWGRIILAVGLLTSITVSGVLAEEAKPAGPGPRDKCPVCGMFVAKYPDFLAQITFKDGTSAFFDGIKDMMKYYFNLAKYQPGKQTGDIAEILVTDYYTLKTTDGLTAYYVVGSNVYGPMGKELVPFKMEHEAEEFKKDHAGKAVIQFKEITPDLIKTLD